MVEILKKRKRIFAILVGIMMVVGQSGYLLTDTVYGATDNAGAGQNYTAADDDQQAAIGGDDAPADLTPADGNDASEDGDGNSLSTESEIEIGQDADAEDTRGPPEGDEEAADGLIGLPTNGESVLAFTSDIHNSSNNVAANRLDTWLTNVAEKHTGINAIGFCGDMGSASAGESDFWTYTKEVMNVVSNRGIAGVYTTGNHEFYNGNFSTTNNPVKNEYKVGEVGLTGDNYIIYCLGTTNWSGNSDNYTDAQIEDLTNDLNELGNDKPIIILTHFPLHSYSSGGWGGGRSTKNADKVIDVINAAAGNGKKIVVLWGHNHTLSDSNYDAVVEPGSNLTYSSSGGSKTLQFYYAAAGCMSDSEYSNSSTSGSASVKGKGLVITINNQNQLSFTYYDANGTDVTKGGTFTEKDPVNATALSLSKNALTVQVGSSENLTVTFTPSDTTNKKVIWTSSNPSVATVSDGKVTGVSKGTATITAAYADGDFEDSCEVTVTNAPGQGVTPENGKKYVILASDGYALTTQNDDVGYSNGTNGSQQYNYSGLVGEKYVVGDEEVPESLLWTFTESEDGSGYYIQSQKGEYLNATYEPNQTDGYDGTLKLDETPDVWTISGKASEGEVNGSLLKSANASKSDAGDKYLTHGNGSEETVNVFTVRSEDNATSTIFYEYDDNGAYVDDDPITPFGPTEEGIRYEEVSALEDGEEYIIAVTKDDGSVYAIKNEGEDYAATETLDLAEASDEDPAYILTEDEGVVWKYAAANKYFTNDGKYLYPTSSNTIRTYNGSSGRAIDYADGKMSFATSSSGTYYITCNDGSFATSNEESEAAEIRLFVKEGEIVPDDPAPTEGTTFKLVNQFTDGKEYLIVSAAKAGDAKTLTNPGGSTDGVSMGRTDVTIQNGDVDKDGTSDAYISSEETNIVWTAVSNGAGFNITNGGDYLEGKSGNVKIYSKQQYADRYWTYTDNQLQHVGGQNTYTVYYDNGFTSTYNSTSKTIYIFEKTEAAVHTHNFEAPIYEWEDDFSKVKATRTCAECGETETETVGVTSEITKPAGCEAKGETTYTSETFANEAFEVQIKTVENIDALGHKWEEWEVTKPATCTEKGEKTRECERCDAVDREELPAVGHTIVIDEAVPATCTQTGLAEGSHCSVCNEVIVEQEVIPALGHNWEHIVKKAGLLKDGSDYYQCTVCGEIKDKKVLAGYATYYVSSLKVTKATKAFTVHWKKQSKTNQKKFDGYQIRYSTKTNMDGAKYTKASKGSTGKTIKKLSKNKKYYVQVRTYTKSGGKTFYSKWSPRKTVKTK